MDYKASGVNIEAGNEVVRRIRSIARGTFTPGVLSDIGSFGGLFHMGVSGAADPVLVASADGVGTKLRLAFMTGFPPRMAEKAQEAVPGFQAPLSLLELGLGILATAAWIALVLWRVSRQPRPFWRPMALSSGGMVLTWFLLMTLWLPAGIASWHAWIDV